MNTNCPKCGFALEEPSITRLKGILKNMNLNNRLADYILDNVDQDEWHPEVKTFAYNNLLINKI